MEGPVKKRKGMMTFAYYRLVFDLVFPWVFYGHYKTKEECFRTYLALAGTCAKLRYFNLLRRYIGWLTPPHLIENISSHGFPCYMPIMSWHSFLMGLPVNEGGAVLHILENVNCSNAVSPFDATLDAVPFINLAKRVRDDKTILTFCPDSFAEAVLFCYRLTTASDDELAIYTDVEIYPRWKCSPSIIKLPVKKRKSFAGRYMISKLLKIGTTAPQDYGFLHGQMPFTAFALFMQICNTNGQTDKKKPAERVKQFLKSWYPKHLKAQTATEASERAYDFEIEFEK